MQVMIEFKADCGHTVRARDEDAGGVVRCSYCGRNASVPDSRDSELDFLFRELDEGGEVLREGRRRKGRKAKAAARPKRSAATFDPFAVVLKLCYAALLITIVVVVARMWIMPLFEGPGAAQQTRNLGQRNGAQDAGRSPAAPARRQGTGPGLINLRSPDGLYVTSMPTGAAAYCLEVGNAPGRGRRILDVQGVRQFRTDGECPRAVDGTYVVEIAIPWNEPQLNRFPEYWSFRRAVEEATPERRRTLVENYYMPDDAVDAFVAQTEEQIYIVRQYHAVVRQGKSKGVQALFLPRIAKDDGKSIAIEPLVTSILPAAPAYQFNEEHVRNELAYYEVPEVDRRFVVEALARVGAIAYVTPDGRTRLFKIGMHDGVFATKIVRENPE
jgi:hypothetical protein